MKSLVITRFGGPSVLQIREQPTPEPQAGQVRIRVARAGINFADIAARLGLYPDAPKPPMVVGYEVSGTVEAVGPSVSQLQVGQRVFTFTHFQGQATHVVVPEKLAMPMPDGMSFEDGAALPVNYLTAYHILFVVSPLKPNDRVLVHSAGGGVGLAAIQLCRLVDGVAVFGTASPSKHALLREAGLAHPIDYRSADYAEEVRRLTGGAGVQKVLDPLGGPDWSKGYKLLAPAGQLVCYGFSNIQVGEKRNLPRVVSQLARTRWYSPMSLMDDNRSVAGVNMGKLWDQEAMLRQELDALVALYQAKKIKPHVDKVFRLEEGAEAHRYIQDRKNFGKVLLDCT